MTSADVEKYIREECGKTPRHNCDSLASAISDIAYEQKMDERGLMKLLLGNVPMTGTHSYGFHTRLGRFLIEEIQDRYYEYEG